ncbi:MAG: glutamate--cysteine ligase [Aeromicrobium sp.]
MRTVGIEEELLLVDATDGRPRAVAERVLQAAAPVNLAASTGALHHELQQQQLETNTPPRLEMAELDLDVRAWRDTAIMAARAAGAHVVATGTSPMPVQPDLVHTPRYERIAEQFGITTSEQLTCGCHVHVAVDSDEEGVGVLDRIRVWLPALLAISANSPFWQGRDTHYASFRSQAVVRWPTSGPADVLGSAEAYHRLVEDMLATNTLVDSHMVYFDARLSDRYPTVEIRIADVCLDARDTVLVAALCRSLVETAAEHWRAGVAMPSTPATPLLRLATWQAGRHGLGGDLLDPVTSRPAPAHRVVSDLVAHVRPALRRYGDETLVDDRLAAVLVRGNGAVRQRSVLGRTGSMAEVVADLARATAGQDS